MTTNQPAPSEERDLRDIILGIADELHLVRRDVTQLKTEVELVQQTQTETNTRVEIWDGRLWALTLGLIGTAWTAIIAAAVVVIVRSLTGQA